MNTGAIRLRIIIFGSLIAIFLVLLGLSLWSWISLYEAETRSFNTTNTTFIGSSDVAVPLGCYPQSTVKSVSVNRTSTDVKVYHTRSKFISTNLHSLAQNITKPGPILPFIFSLYKTPLYSAKSKGSITYTFSIQLTNSSELTKDDCVLNVTVFAGGNGSSEYQKFKGSPSAPVARLVQTYNHTCLAMKPHETEGVFNITYVIPAEKFTYFAALAASGVHQVNYTVSDGFITYYKTTEKFTADHCTHDKCTVTIGDRYPLQTSSQKICIFAELTDDSDYAEEYIRVDVKKVDANALIIGFTGAAGFILCVILIGALVITCKQRILEALGKLKIRIMRNDPLQAAVSVNAEGRPLLRNKEKLVIPEPPTRNAGSTDGQNAGDRQNPTIPEPIRERNESQPAQNPVVQSTDTNLMVGHYGAAVLSKIDDTTSTTIQYAEDDIQESAISQNLQPLLIKANNEIETRYPYK